MECLNAAPREIEGITAHAHNAQHGTVFMFKRTPAPHPDVKRFQDHFLSLAYPYPDLGVTARYNFAWIVWYNAPFSPVPCPRAQELFRSLHLPFFLTRNDTPRRLYRVDKITADCRLVGAFVPAAQVYEHIPIRSTPLYTPPKSSAIVYNSLDSHTLLAERTKRLRSLTKDSYLLKVCHALEQGGIPVTAIS